MALEEGGEYNVLHNAGINVWTGRTGCMGIREASEYFFFFGGGGGGGVQISDPWAWKMVQI